MVRESLTYTYRHTSVPMYARPTTLLPYIKKDFLGVIVLFKGLSPYLDSSFLIVISNIRRVNSIRYLPLPCLYCIKLFIYSFLPIYPSLLIRLLEFKLQVPLYLLPRL